MLGDDLNAAEYYAQPNAEDAFRLLRSRTEDAGVFVLLKGDLGSHHTAIDVEVFRGLAIADDVAPFVVINDNDSRAAWSFTLLHELTHLLLRPNWFQRCEFRNRDRGVLQQRRRRMAAAPADSQCARDRATVGSL